MISRSIIVLTFLLTFQRIHASEVGIEVLRDCSVPLDAGAHCTFAFRVSNHGTGTLHLVPSVGLPQNWKCICPDTVFSLAPAESGIRLVTVIIPLKTAAGAYSLDYRLFVRESGETVSLNSNLTVKEKTGIGLSLLDAPAFVLAGEPIHAFFSLSNLGNRTVSVKLKAKRGSSLKDSIQLLPPDSMVMIHLVYHTEPDLPRTRDEVITLEATINGLQDVADKKARASAFVRVIPLREKKAPRYYHIPATGRLALLGKQTGQGEIRSGWQGELTGGGTLSPGSPQIIAFGLRGPDQFQISPLGLTEEYYIRYRDRVVDVFAGDKTFSLTPLTLQSRYGRGSEITVGNERLQWGGFYSKARYTPFVRDEQAVYSRYMFRKDAYLQAAGLRKNIAPEQRAANIVSLSGGVLLFGKMKASGEISGGAMGSEHGYAYRSELSGKFKKLDYSAHFTYAGPDYPGYYKNSRMAGLALSLSVNSRITASLSVNQDDQNASLDTLEGISPYTGYLRGGLIYRYHAGNYLMITGGVSERKDRMPLQGFHYRENNLRAQLSQKLGFLNLRAEAETGLTRNIRDQVSGGLFSSMTHLEATVSKAFSLNAFAGQVNSYRYGGSRQNQSIFGGGLNIALKNGLSLYGRYQNAYSPEEYYLDRNLLDVNVGWRFGQIHEIRATGKKTLVRKRKDEENMVFAMMYVVHLPIPVKRTTPAGTVSGKVAGPDGVAVAGVILRLNGHTAVTDKQGTYRFVNVKPGSYLLLIDRSSLDFGLIPDIRMPVSLEVVAGMETGFSFGLIRSGEISGTAVYRNGNGSSSKPFSETAGNNALLIEIRMGDEVQRRLTDSKGAFSFKNLRPGNWEVMVYRASLADDKIIEKTGFQVNLPAGETVIIEPGITDKKRTIRFQQEELKINYR